MLSRKNALKMHKKKNLCSCIFTSGKIARKRAPQLTKNQMQMKMIVVVLLVESNNEPGRVIFKILFYFFFIANCKRNRKLKKEKKHTHAFKLPCSHFNIILYSIGLLLFKYNAKYIYIYLCEMKRK